MNFNQQVELCGERDQGGMVRPAGAPRGVDQLARWAQRGNVTAYRATKYKIATSLL